MLSNIIKKRFEKYSALKLDLKNNKVKFNDFNNLFEDGTFDIIVMGGLLYHLLSPLRALLIARSLLKTGGFENLS